MGTRVAIAANDADKHGSAFAGSKSKWIWSEMFEFGMP